MLKVIDGVVYESVDDIEEYKSHRESKIDEITYRISVASKQIMELNNQIATLQDSLKAVQAEFEEAGIILKSVESQNNQKSV